MRRILAASLLALLGLGVCQTTASADCFHVYKPCYKFPVPPIPIFCPSFKFFCEGCNHGCGCPCPGAPWYAQFPQGAPMGYAIAPYGAFSGSMYGGGYGSYGQPAYAWSGYGQGGYAAPAWNNGYAAPVPAPAMNGYGGYYTAQTPYYWRQ